MFSVLVPFPPGRRQGSGPAAGGLEAPARQLKPESLFPAAAAAGSGSAPGCLGVGDRQRGGKGWEGGRSRRSMLLDDVSGRSLGSAWLESSVDKDL